MDKLQNSFPALLPLIVLEIVLMLLALIHLLRHRQVRHGNFILWLLVICFLQFIGPILYFTFGKEDS